MSPEAYFSKFISSKLAQHQEQYPKEMQILLVPSLQDVIHETIVMPQPGFEHPRTLGLPPVSFLWHYAMGEYKVTNEVEPNF